MHAVYRMFYVPCFKLHDLLLFAFLYLYQYRSGRDHFFYFRFANADFLLYLVFLFLELFLPEAFNPAGGVEHFFLSGVERMAGRADFHLIRGLGSTHGEYIPARAGDFSIRIICRMNIGLHGFEDLRFKIKDLSSKKPINTPL